MTTLGITTLATRLVATARLGRLGRLPVTAVPLPAAAAVAGEPALAPRRAQAPRVVADTAGEELAQAREHVRSLERQVAGYLQQYALAKDALKKEILKKNAVSMELAAACAQVSALLGRVHELEMDHGVARAASTTVLEAMVRDAALATRRPEPPARAAVGPADTAALHNEVERWKRHCQTLGAALKQERARRQR